MYSRVGPIISQSVQTRRFAAKKEKAVEEKKEDKAVEEVKAAPSEPPPPPRSAGVVTRIRSFTLGFLVSSAISFYVLVLEGEKSLSSLKESVQKVFEYQRMIESRLERCENQLKAKA